MIYITGGAGFIGSNLVRLLNNKGLTDICIVDRLRSNGKWKNVVDLKFNDLIDPEVFDFDTLNRTDIVVHLGACSSTLEQNADFLWLNNVKYSTNLIDDCVSERIRIIYASSAAVYGDGKNGFSDSQTLNLKPRNPYGFSKLRVDQHVISNNLESHVVGLRFFNVWGNGEAHKGSMRSFPSRVRELFTEKKTVNVYTVPNIKLERDFVYIGDVCELIFKFMNQPSINGIFNVGTGESNTWIDIANTIADSLNVDKKLIQMNTLPEELMKQYQFSTKADISKLLKAFPNFKFTPFKEALIYFSEQNEN